MPLNEERLQFISDIANGTWVDRLPPDEPERQEEFDRLQKEMDAAKEEFLKGSTSAEELHEFASRYNWDKGIHSMIDLVRNPSCDKNTALLVFWLSGVDYYQEDYATRDSIEEWNNDELNTWDMIHYIIEKVATGGYGAGNMPLDYKGDIYKSDTPLWEIPGCMSGDDADNKIPDVYYDADFGNYGT